MTTVNQSRFLLWSRAREAKDKARVKRTLGASASTFASGASAFVSVFALASCPIDLCYLVCAPTFRSTGYRSMAYTPSTGFGSLSDDKDAGSTVDSNADSTAIAADFVFASVAGSLSRFRTATSFELHFDLLGLDPDLDQQALYSVWTIRLASLTYRQALSK
ncbi:hypothetical protein Q3G72_005756 [Acer saccharum]|nr:hypothetical protein Q3G72_005756 [Acer saccharum]